jgi:Tol biopolymer transport system component/DNA-binding winged helix-turn-helix (wHTH) protein
MHHEAKWVFEFGPFRLDGRDGSLTSKGRPIALPPKAVDVLLVLVEDAGNVVSKEKLAERVWAGTTVGAASVNYQIFLIRQALRDGLAVGPCIETIPKRGFRFACPVKQISPPAEGGANAPNDDPTGRPEALPARRRQWWRYVAPIAGMIGLAFGTVALLPKPPTTLRVVGYTALTNDREPKYLTTPLLTDGDRVYYQQRAGQRVYKSVPAQGGETVPIFQAPSPFELVDVSPVRGEYLALRADGPALAKELWALPVASGAPRRIGGLVCLDATLSPDGQQIACSMEADLYVTRNDGTRSRKLPTPPGRPKYLRWSPSGDVVRFTLATTTDREQEEQSLWEVRADGSGLHPLLPRWNTPPNECCGVWTPDGNWFVFQSTQDGRTDLWAMRARSGWLGNGPLAPSRLTAGPLGFAAPSISKDGKTVFAIGVQSEAELVRYDLSQRDFKPYLPGIRGTWLTFSPDRHSIAYVGYPDGHLWRSRPDGSDRKQLTFGPFSTDGAMWSPDGKWIAFRSRMEGKYHKIYLIPAEGGEPRPIISEDREQGIPSWSPDSTRLTFGDVPEVFGHAVGDEVLHIYDIARREFSVVPGSAGQRLWTSRWSPDGRYLSAQTIDGQQLRLFDFRTATWQSFPAVHVGEPAWSHDGKFIYYDTEGGTYFLRRVRISDGRVEELADLLHYPVVENYGWTCGLTPDDSPIILRTPGATEIYALQLDVR